MQILLYLESRISPRNKVVYVGTIFMLYEKGYKSNNILRYNDICWPSNGQIQVELEAYQVGCETGLSTRIESLDIRFDATVRFCG